jgi:hypothetical protein
LEKFGKRLGEIEEKYEKNHGKVEISGKSNSLEKQMIFYE